MTQKDNLSHEMGYIVMFGRNCIAVCTTNKQSRDRTNFVWNICDYMY